MQLCQQPGDQLGSAGILGEQPLEAWKPKHVTVRVVRFRQAIGVQEDVIAVCERRLVLVVFHVWHEPKRHSPRPQLQHPARRSEVRNVVASIGIAQSTGGRLQHGVQAGHEHVGRDVVHKYVIGPF